MRDAAREDASREAEKPAASWAAEEAPGNAYHSLRRHPCGSRGALEGGTGRSSGGEVVER